MYKRQAESAAMWKERVWDKTPILIDCEDPMDQLAIRFAQYHSVSYTHLDVYKRQGLSRVWRQP